MSAIHQCAECGDDGTVVLHGRCHINSPTWAKLSGDVLTIECAECERVIVRFRVTKTIRDDGTEDVI
jgi:hypothetical protein